MDIQTSALFGPALSNGKTVESRPFATPRKRVATAPHENAPGTKTRCKECYAGGGLGPASDWGTLMAAAQTGEAASYRHLLDLLRPWLEQFFWRRLPMPMVQDTLIAIHTKRHTYDTARPFEPWLSAIARYKWIDRLRAMKRVRFEQIDERLSIPDHHTAVISAIVIDSLLDTLKPAQSRVIRLVKLEGLSIEDAAIRSGQSVPLVKVNIHRGLGKMALAARRCC
jgi:RNA polymerase sigma-70 factor (ECF subfamily)